MPPSADVDMSAEEKEKATQEWNVWAIHLSHNHQGFGLIEKLPATPSRIPDPKLREITHAEFFRNSKWIFQLAFEA